MKHTVALVGLSAILAPAAGLLRGRSDYDLAHEIIDGCGGAPEFPNSRTKKFADGQPTRYNVETKKTEPVVFKAGDAIDFECIPGFTLDSSKDGPTVYQATCTEGGYFKPGGVCVAASKCGPVPNISHALPTGQTVKGGVEFACAVGFSLDGEKVVAGGMGKNRFFNLKCVEFSGSYEEFSGECKPYAFVASSETMRMYNQVGEALFIVSCKGSLKTHFGAGKAPAGLDSVCAGFEDQSAACGALVTTIKGDFEKELKAREDFDKAAQNEAGSLGKEWHEKKDDPARPNINDEAQTFCSELWQLLKLPSGK